MRRITLFKKTPKKFRKTTKRLQNRSIVNKSKYLQKNEKIVRNKSADWHDKLKGFEKKKETIPDALELLQIQLESNNKIMNDLQNIIKNRDIALAKANEELEIITNQRYLIML